MKWKDSTGRRGQEKEVSNKQKELNSVLCVDIEGWDWGVGGRIQREGIYVYLQLTHTVQQKIRQHCEEIILQLEKSFHDKLKKKKADCFSQGHLPNSQQAYQGIASVVLTRKFQTDQFKFAFLAEADTSIRLGVKS